MSTPALSTSWRPCVLFRLTFHLLFFGCFLCFICGKKHGVGNSSQWGRGYEVGKVYCVLVCPPVSFRKRPISIGPGDRSGDYSRDRHRPERRGDSKCKSCPPGPFYEYVARNEDERTGRIPS